MLVETSGGQIFSYARPPRPTSAPDMWGDNNIEMGGQGDSVPKLCQDNPSGETPKDSEQENAFAVISPGDGLGCIRIILHPIPWESMCTLSLTYLESRLTIQCTLRIHLAGVVCGSREQERVSVARGAHA